MRLKKIGHVVLRVCDLARSETFYTNVLGFQFVSRLDQPRAVFLTLGEQHHDVALFEVGDRTAESRQGEAAGLDHVGLELETFDDLKQAYAELKQAGIAVRRSVDHGLTRSIYLCDPSGNGIELFCNVGSDGLARARRSPERTFKEFKPLDLEA